jgi:hypothetical protein
MGENKFVIAIWAGVSSNDALSSPARTKRLLRRLHGKRKDYKHYSFNLLYWVLIG